MKKWILAALLVLPLQAHAILINSSVGTFEVTTVEAKGSADILKSTAWWGSEQLAREFAGRVNNDLGLDWVILASVGPFFAYKNTYDDTFYAVYISTILGDYVTTKITDEDYVRTYAVSRRVSGPPTTAVPEPTSLALLGIGLVAFGLRRRFARG